MPNHERVDVPGLPQPWIAFFHQKRQRNFYYNTVTKASTWSLPDVKPDDGLRSLKRGAPNDLDCEMDDVTVEDQSVPMELDSDDVVHVRNQMLADFILDLNDALPICAKPASKRDFIGFVVFDTCSLIQNPKIIDIARNYNFVCCVPYTVLCELDQLKSSNNKNVKHNAIVVNRMLNDYTSQSDSFVGIESSVQARERIDGFAGSTNDDRILKCAIRMRREAQNDNTIEVFFVTNDHNLAVKARAHGLFSCKSQDFEDNMDEFERRRSKAPAACLKKGPADPLSQHQDAVFTLKDESAQSKPVVERPLPVAFSFRDVDNKRKEAEAAMQRDLAMDIQESELETSAVKTVEGSWPTLVPETTPRSFAAHAQKPVKSQGPMGGFAQSQLGRNGFPSSEVVSPFVQSKDDGHEHSSISRSDVNSLSTEQGKKYYDLSAKSKHKQDAHVVQKIMGSAMARTFVPRQRADAKFGQPPGFSGVSPRKRMREESLTTMLSDLVATLDNMVSSNDEKKMAKAQTDLKRILTVAERYQSKNLDCDLSTLVDLVTTFTSFYRNTEVAFQHNNKQKNRTQRKEELMDGAREDAEFASLISHLLIRG